MPRSLPPAPKPARELRDEMWLRLRMAWACLCGRSVMYRMRVDDGTTSCKTSHGFVVDSDFIGRPIGDGVTDDAPAIQALWDRVPRVGQ